MPFEFIISLALLYSLDEKNLVQAYRSEKSIL